MEKKVYQYRAYNYNIVNMINKHTVHEIINMLHINNASFLKEDMNIIKNDIIDIYLLLDESSYNNSDIIKLNEYVDKLFEKVYILKQRATIGNWNGNSEKTIEVKLNNMMTPEQRDIEYDRVINEIKSSLTGDIKKRADHYDYLRYLPQPAQKSREWYELRNGMITASSAADILGESKYNTREEMLLDKLGLSQNKYKENMFVYHGKKYERIATLIYEFINNTKVGEFGLVSYQSDNTDIENINFIGASPDGINTCITLDGKINGLVGRMLEIKCPLKRKIITSGTIDGEIIPHYYWVQVQVQLATCKNDSCDFWQCDIREYSDDEWIMDNTEDGHIDCVYTCEQNERKEINVRLTKGCIIQLMPIDKSNAPLGDKQEWYAKYIYPSNLLMTDKEYIEWIEYMEKNWKTIYPQYVKDYYYDKVLYWKLHNCHNVLVMRDIQWFNSKVPLFKKFWNDVLYYRKHPKLSRDLSENYLERKKQRSIKYSKNKQNDNTVLDKIFINNGKQTKKSKLLNFEDAFLSSSGSSND